MSRSHGGRGEAEGGAGGQLPFLFPSEYWSGSVLKATSPVFTLESEPGHPSVTESCHTVKAMTEKSRLFLPNLIGANGRTLGPT